MVRGIGERRNRVRLPTRARAAAGEAESGKPEWKGGVCRAASNFRKERNLEIEGICELSKTT